MFIQGGRKWFSEEETASCMMHILYTSSSCPAFLIYANWRGSPSSLATWTLVPSLLVIFEGKQRRKMQIGSGFGEMGVFLYKWPSSEVFPEERSRCFTWYVSYSNQILTGNFFGLRILHFSLCCCLSFLPFFSLKASPLISSLCNFPPQ